MISNGVGFVHEKDDYWCIPKPRNCAPPWLEVTLWVTVDKPPTPESMAATSLERHLQMSGITRLSRDAGWAQDNEYVQLYFVAGPYFAEVRVRQNPRAGLATLAIAQNYAHAFADKLRAAGARAELPF